MSFKKYIYKCSPKFVLFLYVLLSYSSQITCNIKTCSIDSPLRAKRDYRWSVGHSCLKNYINKKKHSFYCSSYTITITLLTIQYVCFFESKTFQNSLITQYLFPLELFLSTQTWNIHLVTLSTVSNMKVTKAPCNKVKWR